jgi:hypothetical protein
MFSNFLLLENSGDERSRKVDQTKTPADENQARERLIAVSPQP